MPLQLVRLFRRRNHRAASTATSNVSELAGTSNSNSNDTQAGAQLRLSTLGTIHGSLFSNNQLNQIHHHHHHPQADDDADYAEINLRDIILETELDSGFTRHDLQSDNTLVEFGRIRKYTGRLFHQPHGSMLIHKYEGLAITTGRAFQCVVCIFHNPQRNRVLDYHLSLSGAAFVTYMLDVMDQLQSARNALQKHGLQSESEWMPSYNVDYHYVSRLYIEGVNMQE
ncbi:hypothetical protein C8J56DRAFT_1019418 [Mycena floridula]|nr:hypothetical protein C8J56DRAFT_1019418 [Mycena floridula]